ncbi:MAG TPA: DUF3999 domain-containing protein [Casimicrobiaceae bacterium]|nr:DUF3999 domain-containing protein [Casimicrobiaceae bacterium]
MSPHDRRSFHDNDLAQARRNRMTVRGWSIVVGLAAWPLAASAAEAPADFAQRQPLATESDKAFFRLEVPDSVYEGAARADLGDLRVFNGDGAVVPFAFLPRPPAVTAASPPRELAFFPLTVDTTQPDAADLTIKLRRDAAGTSVDIRSRDGTPVAGSRVVGYLIDVPPEDKPLVALRIPLPDGGPLNTRARIDASDDLDRWRTLVGAAPLLALEYAGRRLVRDRIELPPVQARYLRLTWLSASSPELRSVLGDVGDRVVDTPRRIRRANGTRDAGVDDAFVFDLGAALPVDRVTLALPEVNTVAPIAWEARTTADAPWHSLGTSIAYRLRQDDAEIVNDEHRTGGSPLRYFRVRIDPKAGGASGTPPVLVAGWVPQEIVFAARGTGPFELAYGSRRSAPGALPIATLIPGYAAAKPLPANVGIATLASAPSIVNADALRAPLDVKRWLLWGSLIVASLVLGYMAWRLAQQMKTDATQPVRDDDGDAGTSA